MHLALTKIKEATSGTLFEGDLWLVGGAVRDDLLGLEHRNDFDLVTRCSSANLANFLFEQGVSTIPPVTYERFGTAMVHVQGVNVELVTARRESYDEHSRKPNVEPASYHEDALRRDFTINTLMQNLHSGELRDPLGLGRVDMAKKILRTPQDPLLTFHDDPLRMLRAVRFRWKLGFEPAPGLYDAIRESRQRLQIISFERIRDEFVKILGHSSAPDALEDLLQVGIIEMFAPEFLPMVGCEQGKYHHLDVWQHSLLVLRNVGNDDKILSLAALLHDVGKPSTRTIDSDGNTRFFSHEVVGADLSRQIMRRLKFPERDIDRVVALVKNHMRLGSAPTFTAAAARRVLRDLGEQTDRLLDLVEADTKALRPGVRVMDLATIRERLATVQVASPRETLQSPLSGQEIMRLTGVGSGPEVGRLKSLLTERVLDGTLAPQDKQGAETILKEVWTK